MNMPAIHTLTGDGAFAFVHDECVRPFLEQTGAGIFKPVEHDWSLNNRVRTDGAVVKQGLAAIMDEKAAAVKYPGATATKEELAYAVQVTDSVPPKTALGKGKSPNAVVRGAAGLDASIVRPPARSAALIKPLETHWSADKPVEIQTLAEGGRKANAHVVNAVQDGTVAVTFTSAGGSEQALSGAGGEGFAVTAGSPVTVTHVDMDKVEARIRATFDDALAKKADVTLATKNTVLTSVDAPILDKAKAIFDAEYKERFAADGLKFSAGLVDDAFAYLLANEWAHGKPLIMLCPDDCYGAQMQHVLAAVKENGLNYDHTKHPIAVARLSNGHGDEYGGIHFTPDADGTLAVANTDGTRTSLDVKKGEMWLVSAHDVAAAKTYANRMIDYALSNQVGGSDTGQVYFGFDEKSPAEAPLAAAIREVIESRREALAAKNITAEIRDPAEIAAEMLTNPPTTGTILALNNLWGDIMADLFPALANNKASYDSLLISDKGFMVETGAGGTAGGLLDSMLKDGKMPLNPIAILSGYAHAMRYRGTPEQVAYAGQLEDAIDRTLKQGYLTGDLMSNGKPQLRDEFAAPGVVPHAVDARVFIQAVTVNMLALQGKEVEMEAARKVLEEMAHKHDFANPALPDADTKEVIKRYLTKSPDDLVIGTPKAELAQPAQALAAS